MGLISDLLLFPVTAPARGLLFIAEQLKAQVDDALLGETTRIQDELLNLGMRYEQGEIFEEEYTAQEARLLEELDRVRLEQEEWFQLEGPVVEADEANADDLSSEEDDLSSEEGDLSSDAATDGYDEPDSDANDD